MAAEEKITTVYQRASVREKIEIILDHYPNFDKLIEGLQELLAVSIEIDRSMSRRRERGDLGVRVQTSRIADPTAEAAIGRITLIDAIDHGNLDHELRNTECPEEYRQEAEIIALMKEDYRVVRACILVLPCDKAHILQDYYTYKSEARQISAEEAFNASFYTKVYRIRKQIKDNAEKTLLTKYGRAE